ncbi:MAG: LysM peptidoglycan-binding domain-containing protein [Candidatus Cloacimonetes bacterium]|nr:LysM peptidoglycan-binding domain-containing protein [Candidatus Cloacimonadota bacterium]
MKKIIFMTLLCALLLPVVLQAKVVYLNEDEYKKLKKNERLNYWGVLESDLAEYQQRKADAIAKQDQYRATIEELNSQIVAVDTEYNETYNRIMTKINVSKEDFGTIENKIATYQNSLQSLNNMSDKELWNNHKKVMGIIEEYKTYRQTNQAKVPDFRNQFSDLDNQIMALENDIERVRPKYYEDNYTVKKGEYLAKISGYEFIYNDATKWPIIYRANRDQIKDPNLIYPNQVLKIPRGLPNSWKVYRGECLWRIASYPEVYGQGSNWTKIYTANKDQIKDPDLIYPNQVFEIPRD